MQSETKGVLGIVFGIFAFANPVSELFLVVYNLFLSSWLNLEQRVLITDYVIIKVIFSIFFLIASVYFSMQARREKSKKLGTAGIVVSLVSLALLVWYVYGMLKLGGFI